MIIIMKAVRHIYLRKSFVVYRRYWILREVQVLDPTNVHESVTLDGVQITVNYPKLLNVHTKLKKIICRQSGLWHSRDREETQVPHLP